MTKVLREAMKSAGIETPTQEIRRFNPRPLRVPQTGAVENVGFINIGPQASDGIGKDLYWSTEHVVAPGKMPSFIAYVASRVDLGGVEKYQQAIKEDRLMETIAESGIFTVHKTGVINFGKWFQANHKAAADMLWSWILETAPVYDAMMKIPQSAIVTSLMTNYNKPTRVVMGKKNTLTVEYRTRPADWERWYIGTIFMILHLIRKPNGQPRAGLVHEYELFKKYCGIGETDPSLEQGELELWDAEDNALTGEEFGALDKPIDLYKDDGGPDVSDDDIEQATAMMEAEKATP